MVTVRAESMAAAAVAGVEARQVAVLARRSTAIRDALSPVLVPWVWRLQ